ncbi:excinuclease ABC subunit UvrC [Ammonifex thiophilus]|uniref:UvrABC system protein C n=1 Tax=Ammonifex thiophilus TaxID=444093 RepID=A0A3D8P6G5_9THEO|nr:excinuclease ABC subunit UvrC [Ammonifex thiophilus]RDV84197.1 excinuclease ABC subunit UvrC [Ammonifex thiophilus]
MKEELLLKAQSLPAEPGVYLFKDERGEVIYVGKAASLRQRVKSYFQANPSPKVEALLRRAASLDFMVTGNEVEALILEANLIKRYRPYFNVVLKDDKSYPYIKVTVGEEYPRVLFTRRRDDGQARYFGPYTQAGAVYETLRFLRTLFPYRSCSGSVPRPHSRPCLNYHIKRCPGPCTGQVDPEVYRRNIEALCLFLEGRYRQVVRQLEREMKQAAEELAFERAAVYRDRLQALKLILERQRVVSSRPEDLDVVGLARQGDRAQAVVLLVREGRLIGQESFLLTIAPEEEQGLLTGFLKQYYGVIASSFPSELVLPSPPLEEALVDLLRSRAGFEVKIVVPRRGHKRELLELAEKNAWAALNEGLREAEAQVKSLSSLAEALGLPRVPHRIEGYDASHLQGAAPVAVMVVFVGGKPYKSGYRRFALTPLGKPDDYQALREIFYRRFVRARQEEEAIAEGRIAPRQAKFLPLPDLILVDGGAGQAGVAREVLEELGYDIPVFGLAKEEEWIYPPHQAGNPIILPRSSPALHLLQRVRDEAHRFALGFHRRRREKESLRSLLSEIEGIGPARRSALLRAFPTLEALARASVEELARVPGMTRPAAEAVYRYFHGSGEIDDKACGH